MDQKNFDLSALNLTEDDGGGGSMPEELPKLTMAREKLLEEAKRSLEMEGRRQALSLVVIGMCASHTFCLDIKASSKDTLMRGSLLSWDDFYMTWGGLTRKPG